MIDDRNISLPVAEIIKRSYKGLTNNIKSIMVFSYLLAIPVYLVSKLLPSPANGYQEASPVAIVLYFVVCFAILIVVNIFFYRLFILQKGQFFKITVEELMGAISRIAAYLLALLGVLFVTLVTAILFIAVIVSVFTELGALNEAGGAVVNLIANLLILSMIMLINMRIQPTFISIAANGKVLPMKSAYYYTRDNNKPLLVIGLLCMLPALALSSIIYMGVQVSEVSSLGADLLNFALFPLLLLPNILLFSAGAEIYKFLVSGEPNQQHNTTDITA